MHIPDGYLSPSTCAALYAAVLPFWAAALRRVKALLATRFVPLVSLFAAFSFVDRITRRAGERIEAPARGRGRGYENCRARLLYSANVLTCHPA